MTQQLLESLTYEIVPMKKVYDITPEPSEINIIDEYKTIEKKPIMTPRRKKKGCDVSYDETTEIGDLCEDEKKKFDCERNLIRKVEMNLDYETEMHIYEDRFKILVKKQTPFYISKKTWKLMLKKQKTINTASVLTEI